MKWIGSDAAPVALDRARADLVDRDDARVVERGRRLGFDDEAPEPLFVADEPRREDLQRDASLEGEILGEIDLAHASRSQGAHDPIVGDPVARFECAIHRRRILSWETGIGDRVHLGVRSKDFPDKGSPTSGGRCHPQDARAPEFPGPSEGGATGFPGCPSLPARERRV